MGAYVAASRCSQEPMNHSVCGNGKIFVAHTVFLNFFYLLFFIFSSPFCLIITDCKDGYFCSLSKRIRT